MEYYGYAGRILYIDLTTGESRTEPLDMEMAKKFIGGSGIGTRLMFDLLKPGTNPLSPENPIILSAGTLVGTHTPQSSKIQLITKSATPANKKEPKYYVGWASGGSNRFGIMMKNAGYDQIVITGRASRPAYLKIVDDEVEICKADDLWGKKDISETTDELRARHKGSGVLAIGKSGENQVVFALGLIDKRDNFGRNGGATVMGAKNLKAIVIYGTRRVKVWDSRKLLELINSYRKRIGGGAPLAGKILPDKKPTQSLHPAPPRAWDIEWAKLYPPDLSKRLCVKTRACSNCITPCRTVFRADKGEFAGIEMALGYWGHVPRYGKYMELKDYSHVMKLFDVCNRTGTCYVTALAMIKFLTALYERGVITKRDTDGLELKMGDFHSYLNLLEKIVNREGIGDTMALGWYALSERVGMDEDDYENGRGVIKGTSVIPGAEERSLSLMFGNMVNPRPMHLHPRTYFFNVSLDEFKDWCRDLAMSEKDIERIFTSNTFDCGRFSKHNEEGESILYALGVCCFGPLLGFQSIRTLTEFYSAVTGIEITPEEMKKAGERIWNLYKLLNVREGFTRADDTCPGLWAKSMDEPIKEFILGELQLIDHFGRAITRYGLEEMFNNYYDEHGWDASRGIPTKQKLAELGLEEFVSAVSDS